MVVKNDSKDAMKILLADDDRSSRAILEKILSGSDYDFITASTGDQAWNILQKPEPPKLLLLDWMMPGLTGVEIIQRIRQRSDGNNFYAIILTALDMPEDTVFALNEGADDFITKPYDASVLQARVNVGYRIVQLRKALTEKILQLEEANQTISKLAATDELTGLYNRRYFNKQLNDTLSAARRHNFPVSLILADLDHFKRVNDAHGHDMGDQILKVFSESIIKISRSEDIQARWGGEEFILSVPHTPLSGARILAERLHQAFANDSLEKTGIPVTASFGVTQYQPNEDANSLIKRADKALYRAKELGRNQIVYS